MRLVYRVLLVLVLCLTAVALPAVPVQAQCYGPVIELSPEYGPPGTRVTVYGYRFAAGGLVDIDYDGTALARDIRTDNEGDFAYTFIIPEGCRSHYQVLAKGTYSTVDTYFTIKPGLTVTPDNGPPGMTVSIEGKGFASSEEGIELLFYLADGYETVDSGIRANAKGSWEASFQVPASTRGEHKLDARGVISQLYDVEGTTFQVTAGISLDKSVGFVGDTITMTGSRFSTSERGIQILFDGQSVATDIRANSEGEWQASFDVPEMPTGEHIVTAEGDQTRKEDVGELSFGIEPDIALSPTAGHVGTSLTVTGHGFAASEDVNVTLDTTQTTARTSEQGSFDVSLLVPETSHGERTVIAGYGTGNAARASFVMESDSPPIPILTSPADRSRIGIIGREVTPTFEWSGVSDDSGVTYGLQVATNDDFSESSLIASVDGLTETSHTFDEALSYGTYYWAVQAVDGADNESGWATAGSLRIGLLPLWAFIVIIVAVVVLLAALIAVRVRRRVIYYDGGW